MQENEAVDEDTKKYVQLVGKVVNVRKVSKKLFFFDLRCSNSNNTNNNNTDNNNTNNNNTNNNNNDCGNEEKVECICKYWDISLEDVSNCKRDIKLGSTINIHGFFETGANLFHCLKVLQVLETETDRMKPRETERSWKSGHDNSNDVCKYWINTKNCVLGERCPFKHVEGELYTKARSDWIAKRMSYRNIDLHNANDPLDPHHKKSHHLRAKVFADWIVSTFGGTEKLSAGTGVVDVAGGRGGLTFELFYNHNIPTTLVEPRPFKLTKMQQLELSSQSPNPRPISQISSVFDLSTQIQHHKLFENAVAFFGMHPDEATEAIVDYALFHNKSFAVVPCCVFSCNFPERHTQKGVPVILIHDFINYLLEKDPQIKTEYLNFQGRNQVVYKL